ASSHCPSTLEQKTSRRLEAAEARKALLVVSQQHVARDTSLEQRALRGARARFPASRMAPLPPTSRPCPGIAAQGDIDADLLASPAPRSDSDACARVRPENVGIPKSRMCGPQVRFCERGPRASGGPYSTAGRVA